MCKGGRKKVMVGKGVEWREKKEKGERGRGTKGDVQI